MQKLKNTILIDENGDAREIERKDFVEFILQENDVKSYVLDEGQPTQEEIPPEEIVDTLIDVAVQGRDLGEGYEDYENVYGFIREKLEEATTYKEEQKEKKKKEAEEKKKAKEEEKKRKEEEAAKLKLRQERFAEGLMKGADKSRSNLKSDLERLKEDLPEGVAIVANDSGKGFSLEIAEGTSEDTLSEVTGYFMQQAENSEFITRATGFMFGDMCNRLVSLGLFISRRKAAAYIAEKANRGPKLVEGYARMAARIPLDYRNNDVKDRLYLDLANAAEPKKDKDESAEDYKERLEAHKKDRMDLSEKVCNEEIDDYKELRKKIGEMQEKHGLKKPKDNKPTKGELLTEFFHCAVCMQYLDGSQGEDDHIVFKQKDSKDEIKVPTSEIEQRFELAKTALVEMLVEYEAGVNRIKLGDLEAGQAEIKVVKLDGKGKPTKDFTTQTVKVFPRMWDALEKSLTPEKPEGDAEDSAEASSDKEEVSE